MTVLRMLGHFLWVLLGGVVIGLPGWFIGLMAIITSVGILALLLLGAQEDYLPDSSCSSGNASRKRRSLSCTRRLPSSSSR